VEEWSGTVCRLGAVGKEMINGLVGICKCISMGQGLDACEDLSDYRAESPGSLSGGLGITFFKIFDNRSELPGKGIGSSSMTVPLKFLRSVNFFSF